MFSSISAADLQKQVNLLPVNEIVKILKNYQRSTDVNISQSVNNFIFEDLQDKLKKNGINSACPSCNSKIIVGFGHNGKIQRFKCKDCNKTFTLFTGTILEKTKYGWDVWVRMVEMVINHYPMEHMLEVLKKDFELDNINYKTIFTWQHKILHAMAEMPMPKLDSTVQIDETFFRETQKGSRHLESTLKDKERKPRYGYVPSQLGSMGNEFANCVVAINHKGYAVTKVIGLGRLTPEIFFDVFDEYLDNPTFICTDANSVYNKYCSLKKVPHYIKPSSYLDTLKDAGYVFGATDGKTRLNNRRIERELYKNREIDRIYKRHMTFDDFLMIKNANSLSLAMVNQFHGELKRHIKVNTKGVSTKYLADYVGAYTYLHNWKVSNGHSANSNKDAEGILIELLRGKTKYTSKDIEEAKISIHKASGRYMAELKAKTEAMRKLTKNKYFKYDEEDNVHSFDKRKFLEDIPQIKLQKLCKKYSIPNAWSKHSKISELMKKEMIWDEILTLINENKRYNISEEDLRAIDAEKYRYKPTLG